MAELRHHHPEAPVTVQPNFSGALRFELTAIEATSYTEDVTCNARFKYPFRTAMPFNATHPVLSPSFEILRYYIYLYVDTVE